MQASVSASVREAVDHLTAPDESLLNEKLMEFSGLNAPEMDFLSAVWLRIDPERRRQIVRRLVDMAEENVELNFDRIFKFCLKDADEEVRSVAIEGLWENEESSLVEPLVNLLERDSSPTVQASAASALGKFAVLAEQDKLGQRHKARVTRTLLATVEDSRSPIEVRRRALEAAAALSLPEVRGAIADAHQSLDPRLRASAIFAMGRSLDPAWVPELLKELSSPDSELRYEACGACGELEEVTAVPGLTKLTEDADSDVRLAAIQALGKIGTGQAKACLKKCLGSKDEAVREAAGQALNETVAREDPLSVRLDEKE